MKSYTYRIIIEQDEDQFHAFVPALPGCHTYGATTAETRTHLREAMEIYLTHLASKNEDLPEESGLESFETVSVLAHD